MTIGTRQQFRLRFGMLVGQVALLVSFPGLLCVASSSSPIPREGGEEQSAAKAEVPFQLYNDNVNCLSKCWVQAQSGAVASTEEPHNDVPSSLVNPRISQARAQESPAPAHPLQVFECNGTFTLETCRQEMLVLQRLLDKYGADQLGQWKWVLVSSTKWEMMLAENGLSANIPALTGLETRMTLFDDALVAGSPKRLSQLMDTWHTGRNSLLDLTVRHELGHALCKDENESHADHVADLLGKGRPPVCVISSRRPTK